MAISMDKKYRTRDGCDVRLLCVDRKGDYPVVGIFTESGSIDTWTSDGKASTRGPSPADLIEVRPRIKRDVWVNVYEDSVTDAEIITRNDERVRKLARIKITIDCEEGEGL